MTISCTKESCITRILGLCVSRTVLKRLNYYVKTSPTCMYMYAQDRVSGGYVRKEWTHLRRFVWMSQLKFKFWKLSNGKVMNQIIQSVDIKNACLSKRCSSYFSRMYDKSASWMEKKALNHILRLAWLSIFQSWTYNFHFTTQKFNKWNEYQYSLQVTLKVILMKSVVGSFYESEYEIWAGWAERKKDSITHRFPMKKCSQI